MDITQLGLPELKNGIVLLWALWLSLVTLFNIFDALKALAILPQSWVFASGNYAFMLETTKIYRTPRWINAALFAGVIAWELLASLLLWRALLLGGEIAAVNAAFTVSLALWGGFILADEFFLAYFVESEGSYSVASTHREIFAVFLLSLLAIHLL